MVEEYHSQAIAAHQGHGDFEIPLPKLNGQRRADGTIDPVVVRPDGTYAGPSPWSRPSAAPVLPPPSPPPLPVWPEPVDEADGPVDTNGNVDTHGSAGSAGSEAPGRPADD